METRFLFSFFLFNFLKGLILIILTEKNLVGTVVWNKKFFVLRDNLFCWYNKEKDVGVCFSRHFCYSQFLLLFIINCFK